MKLKNNVYSFILTLLFIVDFISGCTTAQLYSEPDLPPQKVARISGIENPGRGITISITEVDNQALSSFNKPIKINVSPGQHVLKVRHERVSFSWYGALPFQSSVAEGNLGLIAEAGKNYVIKASSKGYGVNFWIEEADTGKVVSQDL